MTEVVLEQTVEKNMVSRFSGNVGTATADGGDDEYEEDAEDEDDDDEDAEEIARRLKEQLWADISKAQAARAVPCGQLAIARVAAPPGEQTPSGPPTALFRKQDAVFETMKSILAITDNDALAHSVLASAVVPGTNDNNVLSLLKQVILTESISKGLAKSLVPILVSLARSDALFATMRHSNAPAIQLDKGKRKRDESEDEQRQNDTRASKRQNVVPHDFQRQITEAVKIVANTLTTNSPTNGSLDPSVISSVQLQLHQLFLFSMTSSAGGGPEMNALQEIGGLIQVLGVLSGIQIGPTATQNHAVPQLPPGSTLHPHSHPWISTHSNPSTIPPNDIGTAVYPCLVPGCRKIFARLYSLRAHQRMHAIHRPFRCTVCPASFARNHDLKRHAKLHEKKAWQCAGCDKMFSRRDAIKRHKNSSAARGGKGEICVNAAVREVALDKEGDDDGLREGRRTRMWADIVAGGAAAHYGHNHGPSEDRHVHMEEGEVHGDIIRETQAAVLSLHATLQGHVSAVLGTDHAAPPLHLDPTGGQATLASVIARAQMQNMLRVGSQSQQQIQGGRPSAPAGDGASGLARPEGSNPYDGNANDGPPPISISLDLVRSVDDGAGVRLETAPQLSLYGLSEEQTKLLEQAIANAASAAQAQAEAEAALEEEDEDEEDEDQDQQPDLEDEITASLATSRQ